MTIDNLLAADVVLADGSRCTPAQTENADLFWGLRGGGGKLWHCQPLRDSTPSGRPQRAQRADRLYPFEQAKSVITQFARFTETMPDELNVWMVTRKAPPLPFLQAEVHGKEIVVLAICHAGDPAMGEKLIEPLRGFGACSVNTSACNLTPPGSRHSIRSWPRVRATTGNRIISPG